MGFFADGSGDAAPPPTYKSPGATTVGGSPGGKKFQKEQALDGMKNNDAAQGSNSAAMDRSLERMREGQTRGQMAPENATISGRESDARGMQMTSVDIMRGAAEGKAPSAANYQTQMAMDANMAGMTGGMGSARGLGGLSGAQNNASALGSASGSAALQGGIGRGKEISDAIGMYGTAAGNVAAGDLERLGTSNKNANINADLNDSWTVRNAGLGAAQGNLGADYGDMDMAYFDESREGDMRQMGYDQEFKEVDRGAAAAVAGAKRAAAQAAAARERGIIAGIGNAVGTAAGTAVGGPAVGAVGGYLGGMGTSAVNSSYKDDDGYRRY